MKRWNSKQLDWVENKKIDCFLDEIIKVCGKHGLAISHEDGHGAFEVVNIEKGDFKWLKDASDNTE